MSTFLPALVIFGLVFVGLSIGVLLRGRCLIGVCGGERYVDENGEVVCHRCGTALGRRQHCAVPILEPPKQEELPNEKLLGEETQEQQTQSNSTQSFQV